MSQDTLKISRDFVVGPQSSQNIKTLQEMFNRSEWCYRNKCLNSIYLNKSSFELLLSEGRLDFTIERPPHKLSPYP